ncbi:hypothetical protein [Novosphingobium sp. PC22D]|uniref:hypothetical protein n=1 Tax=Novosphingobium sp. PC22D TaxID=1962403 RepID=UPI001980A8CC|nr:hypothetical protein [Novosphingobium sp. PC22D]
MAIAGGVAVGVAVSALLPRRAGRKVANRAMNIAELAATSSMMLGRSAVDKAEDFGEGTRRKAGLLAGRAERLGEAAADRAERAGAAALGTASVLASSARHRAERLGDAAAHRASKFTHAALDQSTKLIGYPKPAPTFAERIIEKAGEIRGRIRS